MAAPIFWPDVCTAGAAIFVYVDALVTEGTKGFEHTGPDKQPMMCFRESIQYHKNNLMFEHVGQLHISMTSSRQWPLFQCLHRPAPNLCDQ